MASVCICLSAASMPLQAADQGPLSTLRQSNVTGSVRSGYWTSSKTLDDRTSIGDVAVWLRAESDIGANGWAVVDGRIGRQWSTANDHTDSELREAYVALRSERDDIKIGKQIIAWGRADQINPTDSLSARDFTLLAADDNDLRTGIGAVQYSRHFGANVLTAVWLADFEQNRLPFPASTPALRFSEERPDDIHRQGALKLDHSGDNVDWSLSYFNGFDHNPDIALDSVDINGLGTRLTYHRVRVVGADAATTRGPYGLRVEAAYTFTEDGAGRDPATKNPFMSLVMGVDRTFANDVYVNLQYLLRITSKYRSPEDIADPIQRAVAVQQGIVNYELDRSVQGISAKVSRNWLNDTLTAEIAGIYTFRRQSHVIRPTLTYSISDRWQARFGADMYRGEEQTFFGRLRENSTVYIELRYGFDGD